MTKISRADQTAVRIQFELTNRRRVAVKAKTIVTSIGGGGSVSIEGNVDEHNATLSGWAVWRSSSRH